MSAYVRLTLTLWKKSGNWGLDEIDCHRSHKGQYTSENVFSSHLKNVKKNFEIKKLEKKILKKKNFEKKNLKKK